MKILTKIIGFFKEIPSQFVRRMISSSIGSLYNSEKILGDRNAVKRFSAFFETNKADILYLEWIFSQKGGDLIKFMKECSNEVKLYKIEEDKKEEFGKKKAKEVEALGKKRPRIF